MVVLHAQCGFRLCPAHDPLYDAWIIGAVLIKQPVKVAPIHKVCLLGDVCHQPIR